MKRLTEHRSLFVARQIAGAMLAALILTLAVLFATASSAPAAATGGVTLYTNTKTGGVPDGAPIPKSNPPATPAKKKKKRKKKPVPPPVITSFVLGADTLFDEGRPLPLKFRVKARARHVRVRLIVRSRAGTYIKTIELGVVRTGPLHTVPLSQTDLGVSTPGNYKMRLSAADRKGRRAARGARIPPWINFGFADHRFPLVGDFGWGGPDAKFGAGRPGHIHQGQDLTAAEGTPIIAPHGGTITWVKFQAAGAGWYIVLDSAGEDRDYVFMHLQTGSIEVKQGDIVPTGKLLGRVGSTGASSGPHLHFEIWTGGPWQFGGKPADPLPLLQSWYNNAPGQARAQAFAAPVDGQE
jgi:murein DD-endopeptidase MepM/ murein hydrolase activator NlpD